MNIRLELPGSIQRNVHELSRELIYNEQILTPETVQKHFEGHRTRPEIDPFSTILGAGEHGLTAIAEHELLERDFGAFLFAMRRQGNTQALPREKYVEVFEHSKQPELVKQREQRTIDGYKKAASLLQTDVIRPSTNTTIQAIDFLSSANDIENRVAERELEPEKRKTLHKQLDKELSSLIDSLPEEEWGKRLELQELYILRRAIHAEDVGHIVTITHGTIREDLRPDMGSVDLRLTIGDHIYQFQIKTLKAGVSRQTRENQREVIRKADERLEGPGTQLLVLTQEQVQDAYDRAVRQGLERNTKHDKRKTFEPLFSKLPKGDYQAILQLLKLTDEDITEEERIIAEGAIAITNSAKALREKEEREKRKRLEEHQAYLAEQQAILDAQNAGRLKNLADTETARIEALRRQTEINNKKHTARIAKESQIASKRIAAEKEKERQKYAAELKAKRIRGSQKAIETKILNTKRKQEILVKKELLLKPPQLLNAGFLNHEAKNDPKAILAAKKVAEAFYTTDKIIEILEQEKSTQE